MKLKLGLISTTTEYRVIDEMSNLVAICYSKENADFIIRQCDAYKKYIDLAKDILSGSKFLRETDQYPYGFGIDRLEKKAEQALQEAK